jgi:hypothetical protein
MRQNIRQNSKHSKSYSKKQNKTKKARSKRAQQKGGILLKMPANQAFNFFVNNSTVSILSEHSSFGLILKLTLNPNIDSPYEMFSASQYKQPVKCILIKLVALGPNPEEEWEYLQGAVKRIDLEETFQKEVNIQTDIFFKTMNYLEPLCPAPVYSIVYKNKMDAVDFLNLLEKQASMSYPKTIRSIQIIRRRLRTDEIPWLGVLGMEIAENYMPMYNLYNKLRKQKENLYYYEWCEQMAKLQILQLALKTGYSQNDFHRGNLLVNPDYEGMYKGLNGKVLIIDFGLASKLNVTNINSIKELYSQGNFQEALKIFKSLNRSDGLIINNYPAYYGWLYNDDKDDDVAKYLPKRQDEYYNGILTKLALKEEQAIDDRIQVFDEKHKENPEVYPLLPLSNSIKNQFFQGFELYNDEVKKGGVKKSIYSKRRNRTS